MPVGKNLMVLIPSPDKLSISRDCNSENNKANKDEIKLNEKSK